MADRIQIEIRGPVRYMRIRGEFLNGIVGAAEVAADLVQEGEHVSIERIDECNTTSLLS